MIGVSGGNQGGGGVEQHDIAAGGFLPGQYFADQRGVASGVSTGYVIERGALQAEFLGRNCVAVNWRLSHLGDARWGGDGDFVQAVTSVDDERATQTQHAERLCKFLDKVRGIDANYLAGGARGIGQRTEQVEDGA